MSIIASKVTKLYGVQKALSEVSFSIPSGEIVGFLGPNGAGKSTMMKTITCFLPPSSGSVKVCGLDVMDQAIEVKKKVGYLPEHNPLYLDMWVKEYLEFIAGIYKLPKKKARVKEMISLVGLEIEQHKKIGALSKGYRQRVGLAQAMIHDPEVLILDEPTSGLDPNQLVEIRKLITNIGKEKTVMLSTHIMQEVEAICDRAIIINKGLIVADEKVEALRQLSSKDAEIILVEFQEVINESDFAGIPGIKSIKKTSPKEVELVADGSTDVRAAIVKWSVESGKDIAGLSKKSMNMEEVFKQLTASK
ncbi:MAG: gliding motility-associated ABC transporter ATP-binding subunit GldA [Flavobacteriales bacterium]